MMSNYDITPPFLPAFEQCQAKKNLHPEILIFKVTVRWQIKRIPIGTFKKMFM